MSQEPSLTTRYEQPRVPVCPLGFDRGNVVSVQLSDPLQRFPADSEAILHGGLLEFPAWRLGASGLGRETR
jgi:hypothetical protein